jgi:hypothetical protein
MKVSERKPSDNGHFAPMEKAQSTPQIGSWAVTRAGLDGGEEQNLWPRRAPNHVSLLTELFRLIKQTFYSNKKGRD